MAFTAGTRQSPNRAPTGTNGPLSWPKKKASRPGQIQTRGTTPPSIHKLVRTAAVKCHPIHGPSWPQPATISGFDLVLAKSGGPVDLGPQVRCLTPLEIPSSPPPSSSLTEDSIEIWPAFADKRETLPCGPIVDRFTNSMCSARRPTCISGLMQLFGLQRGICGDRRQHSHGEPAAIRPGDRPDRAVSVLAAAVDRHREQRAR